MGGMNAKLPSPSYGNLITILSIDGGGIRGLIPAVVVNHLEKSLQVILIYIYIYILFLTIRNSHII